MANNFFYNLQGIFFLLIPQTKKLEQKIEKLLLKYDAKFDEISSRINYYCNFDQTITPPLKQIQSKKDILKQGSRYCYDFYEYMRYFSPHLYFNLESGDVNYFTKTPSFCKSRPITNFKNNNILLKLDKKRHFKFLDQDFLDSLPFYTQKINRIFFRGGCYQQNRQKFMQKFFLHPLVNAGHVGSLRNEDFKKWYKGKASLKEHLQYKFILSLEGNDVATNLKWIMSSNSLALMPKPKFETWFMEGKLIANLHYLQINEDFTNLEEQVDFILNNQKLAQDIIHNANLYIKQFTDKDFEDLISLLVLRKFFYQTNQIKVSHAEEALFKPL